MLLCISHRLLFSFCFTLSFLRIHSVYSTAYIVSQNTHHDQHGTFLWIRTFLYHHKYPRARGTMLLFSVCWCKQEQLSLYAQLLSRPKLSLTLVTNTFPVFHSSLNYGTFQALYDAMHSHDYIFVVYPNKLILHKIHLFKSTFS